MWRGPLENIICDFVHVSPAVFCISCLSYLDGLEMGIKWLYSCCFLGCWFQDLFNTARSFLFCSRIAFSIRFISVHVVHPYSSIDTTAAWKKFRSEFHMVGNQSISVHTFSRRILISSSVEETLLLGNSPKVRNTPITKIINNELDIKLRQFA